jgi:hypothetical protein
MKQTALESTLELTRKATFLWSYTFGFRSVRSLSCSLSFMSFTFIDTNQKPSFVFIYATAG